VSPFTPHDVVWDDQKIARYWDYLSKVPAALKNCWSKQVGKALLQYVRRKRVLRGRILDYGCGPGFLVGELLELVPEAVIYGVEYSEDTAKLVNQRFRGHPRFKGISLVTSPPTEYDDHYFDAVFFTETIEHIQAHERLEALRELLRLLRPGGVVVVSTPNEEDLEASKAICPDCGAVFHVVQHVTSWSRAGLQSIMEAAGFSTISCTSTYLRSKPSLLRALWDKVRKRHLPHLIYLGEAP